MSNEFQQLLDNQLSDMEWTEKDSHHIFNRIMRGRKAKKKLSFAFVFTIVFILVAVSALAFTINEWIAGNMQQVADMQETGAFSRWNLNDKLRFVDLMKQFGTQIDGEKLALLESGVGTENERDALAYEIIDDSYGDRLRSMEPEYTDIPVENPVPDFYTIFEEMWLRDSPDSTREDIVAAYDAWENTYLQAFEDSDRQDNGQTEKPILTELEILDRCKLNLSEIWSFSQTEIDKTGITVAYQETLKLWIVQMTIHAEDLRVQVQEFLSGFMNGPKEIYKITSILAQDGTDTGASSLEAYEYQQVIPSDAYPDGKDNVRDFLQVSLEEKAAFSAQWKPVMDAWLAMHPDYAQELNDTYDADYLLTRHVYGVPDTAAIPAEVALEIAENRYMQDIRIGVSREMLDRRCKITCLYDVTDSVHPLWKITMVARLEPEYYHQADHKDGYHVIIDAMTGDVLAAYTLKNDSGDMLNADDTADRFF